MTSKQVFLTDNDSTKFLLSVVASPMWEKAVLHAKQAWQDGNKELTVDQIKGVNAFLDVLRDLPNDEPAAAKMPGSKLNHDVDTLNKRTKTPKEKKE